MSIVFHEGLPGAGKSYEACKAHMLPALMRHRQVVTNISGINHQKFSELLGMPLTTVQSLLICIEPADGVNEEDVTRCKKELLERCPDNALIVWDEVQDYWPSGRDKLPIEQQKFITEHRHRGLDFILMGQDRDDVHQLWRNRIESVVYFCKLTAVGKPDAYRWEYWQRQNKKKFVKTSNGVRNYESKFFGLYSSHTGEHVHKEVYKMKGQNILAAKSFTLGIPAVIVAVIWAIYYLYGVFTGSNAVVNTESRTPAHAQRVATPPPSAEIVFDEERPRQEKPAPAPAPAPSTPAPAPAAPPPPLDYVDQIAKQYQLRLSALMYRSDGDFYALIDAMDATYHVKERFTAIDLRALGWDVSLHAYGVKLQKSGVVYVVRQWPMDVPGRVNQDVRSTLR